jgi:hypothetical protein
MLEVSGRRKGAWVVRRVCPGQDRPNGELAAVSRGYRIPLVGIAGEAFRMEARVLKNEFMRGGLFQNVLLRYTGVLIAQISLTAACNRVHTLEKRLCRWLLLTRDRVDSDELVMTQELLAYMLGGRRETVTVAAGRLRDAGLIRHSRGRIVILDRSGLERNACECYRAVHSKCA